MLKLIGKLVLGLVTIIAVVSIATHYGSKKEHYQIITDQYVITSFDNKNIIKETHMVDAIYDVKHGVLRCRSIEDGNMREVKFNRVLIETVEK